MSNKLNLFLDQGTTYSTNIAITDSNGNTVNLTGYTGNAAIRKFYTSINVTAIFNMTINANSGIIIISLTANQTANITYGRYVYDVKLNDGSGNYSRILEGIITINPQVSN